MKILSARQLNIGYKEKTIGHPFTFDLHTGKLYTLIGKNGIGKSTLIKTLSKLLPKISGEVLLNNQPIENFTTEHFAKEISFVFTNQPIHQDLTVYELIALGRFPYTNWMNKLEKEDEGIINNSLKITQVEDKRNKKIKHLSDGQVQRVLIARAIAQDTNLIFLDEPSNHLDLYHKVQLYKLLKNLCVKHNKAIFLSSHDLELSIQLSDEMLVIKEDGNYFGTPNELIENKVFDHFFDDDQIVFNAEQRRFIIY